MIDCQHRLRFEVVTADLPASPPPHALLTPPIPTPGNLDVCQTYTPRIVMTCVFPGVGTMAHAPPRHVWLGLHADTVHPLQPQATCQNGSKHHRQREIACGLTLSKPMRHLIIRVAVSRQV